MRSIITILALCATLISSAQENSFTYHKKDGSITTDSTIATFTRTVTHDSNSSSLYYLEERYLPSKNIKLQGFVKNPKFLSDFVGTKTEYYQNGTMFRKTIYNEQSTSTDTTETFYRNGILFTKIINRIPSKEVYKDKTLDKYYLLVQDSTGNKLAENGNGHVIEMNLLDIDFQREEGTVIDNKKDGNWTGYFLNYHISEKWDNGILIEGISTDSSGNSVKYSQENYMSPPEYPGGLNAFRSELARKFIIPQEAIENGAAGLVTINFIIEKNGNMSNFVVTKDPGYGSSNAALRAIKAVKTKWKPGYQKGRAVKVKYAISIQIHI